MERKTKGTPHPQKPKTINVTDAPNTIAAIINLMKLGIVLLSLKFVANIRLFERLTNIYLRNNVFKTGRKLESNFGRRI
jgi:hypothetical protein